MRFTLPRDLYHGKGSIDELKNLKGKKAFVVTGGGSMKRFGFLDRVVANLKEACAKDASLKQKAATDMEFAAFFENADFNAVVE